MCLCVLTGISRSPPGSWGSGSDSVRSGCQDSSRSHTSGSGRHERPRGVCEYSHKPGFIHTAERLHAQEKLLTHRRWTHTHWHSCHRCVFTFVIFNTVCVCVSAAMNGHSECLRLLISADQHTDINIRDSRGQWVTHTYFVDNDCDVDLTHVCVCVVRTPLMLAVLGGHTDCVYVLLRKGAGVEARDKWGRTALHRGVRNTHTCLIASVNLITGCQQASTLLRWDGMRVCVCVAGSYGSWGVCGGALAAQIRSSGSGQQGALFFSSGSSLQSRRGAEGSSESSTVSKHHPCHQRHLWLHTATLGLLQR